MKIEEGMVEKKQGEVLKNKGEKVRYLKKVKDMEGLENVREYVEEGIGKKDDKNSVKYIMDNMGLKGEEKKDKI